MTDREMLEYAAKAAGIEVIAIVSEGVPHRFGSGYWNPLTDDGDALRLAVKLRLDIAMMGDSVSAINLVGAAESWGNDPCAATRRAIVRAAAEIGKG